MVREVPDQNGHEAYRSLVLRYGRRDAHGETTLLIKVMNFNFGDIDAMETKFEEFNLLIEQSVIHNLPRDASGNLSVPEKARKGFKLMERDDPMHVDFVHKEGQKGKEKGNDKDKGKHKGKSKGKGKQNEKGKSSGKGSRIKNNSRVPAGTVARQDTSGANVGRKAVGPRNKRTMSVRRRKLVT